MIPTWTERCEKFGNKIVTNAMIQQTMQEEIDELREALEKCKLTDEEIERAYWSLVGKQHEGKIASYLYNFARDILKKAREK